jgi:aerobic carbon-monoxide dehydrogenase medium subunit
MFPPRFEYFRANTLTEAVDLAARYGGDGRILAGGQSLIPLMKLRLASPAVLIDINRVKELEVVQQDSSVPSVRIGSLVRHRHLELTKWTAPLASVGDAAKVIGDPQIRNVGTIGGSLAEVDPAGDWGPVMLSLAANIKAISSRGERIIPADEFFLEAYTSALAQDELIREIEVPLGSDGTGTAYLKMERKAGDFAIASAAVRVSVNAEGCYDKVRIALGGVGFVPLRARGAEEHLEGRRVDQQLSRDAALLVEESCDPFADVRGTVEFKRHLAGVLFRRALEIAVDRAQGKEVETIHV